MESGSGLSRSPALICKGFLLSVSMFVGFFGVFFSIWKDMHYAVPSFIFLEMFSFDRNYEHHPAKHVRSSHERKPLHEVLPRQTHLRSRLCVHRLRLHSCVRRLLADPGCEGGRRIRDPERRKLFCLRALSRLQSVVRAAHLREQEVHRNV
ncbi:unnamed protein product [Larinioides sclopetarius]|uniref:Uncharacterized protein n=1 Tax=Larinioides sclopetarius TaxID=280406 RepID=A0AAV2ARP3_9ARAC